MPGTWRERVRGAGRGWSLQATDWRRRRPHWRECSRGGDRRWRLTRRSPYTVTARAPAERQQAARSDRGTRSRGRERRPMLAGAGRLVGWRRPAARCRASWRAPETGRGGRRLHGNEGGRDRGGGRRNRGRRDHYLLSRHDQSLLVPTVLVDLSARFEHQPGQALLDDVGGVFGLDARGRGKTANRRRRRRPRRRRRRGVAGHREAVHGEGAPVFGPPRWAAGPEGLTHARAPLAAQAPRWHRAPHLAAILSARH